MKLMRIGADLARVCRCSKTMRPKDVFTHSGPQADIEGYAGIWSGVPAIPK